MIMHPLLIGLTKKTRHLDIPAELESWLLDEYGWEAIDGLMEPSDLMDAIETACSKYWDGRLDVTPRSGAELWQNRAETAKYMLNALELERTHLSQECVNFMRLLNENGIKY